MPRLLSKTEGRGSGIKTSIEPPPLLLCRYGRPVAFGAATIGPEPLSHRPCLKPPGPTASWIECPQNLLQKTGLVAEDEFAGLTRLQLQNTSFGESDVLKGIGRTSCKHNPRSGFSVW